MIQAYKGVSGFTLVELLVSLFLFVTVMTVSTGALLSVIHANKKAQAIQTAVTNLHSAIDGMLRSVRMGTYYHCGDTGVLTEPFDCADGSNALVFRQYGWPKNSYRMYYFDKNEDGLGGIYRQDVDEYGRELSNIQITAPEVNIQEFKVFVRGSDINDTNQPIVTFIIKGEVGGVNNELSIFGLKKKLKTDFMIQSAATQRLIDL